MLDSHLRIYMRWIMDVNAGNRQFTWFPLQVDVCRPNLAFPSDQQWLSTSELLLQAFDAIPRWTTSSGPAMACTLSGNPPCDIMGSDLETRIMYDYVFS